MAKNRFSLDFEGLEDMARALDQEAGRLMTAAEKALEATHGYVTPKAEAAIQKHRRTGKTEKSLIASPDVKWTGYVAEMGVGFDLGKGGLPSIFLMYGTPRMKPDKALYDALFSSATKKNVSQIQKDTFMKELE